MKAVGLTGGIGAGKSTALALFGEMGVRVVDADQVVHELYAASGALKETLQSKWGSQAITAGGQVDRSAIARIVFADEGERRWLNDLMHPIVRREILEKVSEEPTLCICAVPLLFEAGWATDMWRTVALWCDRATQWQRLRQRGWTDEDIERRLASQMGDDEKLLRADYAIINNGGLDKLAEQCRRIYERIAALQD